MAVDEEALHHSEEGRRSSALGTPTEGSRPILSTTHVKLPEAPASTGFRLPVKVADTKKAKRPPPRLLHP